MSQMLAFALNTGALDKDTAKQVFIKDLAYIKAQSPEMQEELMKTYAGDLTNALKTPDITPRTKNAVLEMVFAYQKGDYNAQIRDYVNDGFEWDELGYEEITSSSRQNGESHGQQGKEPQKPDSAQIKTQDERSEKDQAGKQSDKQSERPPEKQPEKQPVSQEKVQPERNADPVTQKNNPETKNTEPREAQKEAQKKAAKEAETEAAHPGLQAGPGRITATAPEATQKPQNKISREADLTREAVGIGGEVGNEGQKNFQERLIQAEKPVSAKAIARDTTARFDAKMEDFARQHPELGKEELQNYTRVAASAMLATQDVSQGQKGQGRYMESMEEWLKQYDAKDFHISSASSRAAVLIQAAGTIQMEQSMTGKEADNPANNCAKKTIAQAMDGIHDADRRQNFISGIADQVRQPQAQYVLAMDAKEYGLSAEEHEGRGTQFRMSRRADALADKYRNPSANPNYSTQKEFLAFCDRMPEALGGPQAAYDMLKERISGSPLTMQKLERDRESYNEINEAFGMEKIANIEVADREEMTMAVSTDFEPEEIEQDAEEWGNVLEDADEMSR